MEDLDLAKDGQEFECECEHECGALRSYVPGRPRGPQRRKAAIVCDLVRDQLDAAVDLAMAAPDDWSGYELRELVADMADHDTLDSFNKTPRGKAYRKALLKDPPGLSFPPHRRK